MPPDEKYAKYESNNNEINDNGYQNQLTSVKYTNIIEVFKNSRVQYMII